MIFQQYRCRRRNSQSGFTLVELLVAITILGLLVSLSMSFFRLAMRSWTRTSDMSENIALIDSVQSFLRRELNQANPVVIRDQDTWLVDFDGTPYSLGFHAPLPASLGGGIPAEIDLHVENKSNSEKNLIVAWRINSADEWKKAVLLPKIQEARWFYYGKANDTETLGWQTAWVKQRTLPQAIKLDVEFPPEDKRIWTELVVAPKVTMSATCIYEPATKGCREL